MLGSTVPLSVVLQLVILGGVLVALVFVNRTLKGQRELARRLIEHSRQHEQHQRQHAELDEGLLAESVDLEAVRRELHRHTTSNHLHPSDD